MRHRIRWESRNYRVNNPGPYVVCCTCGEWLQAKTRADALTLMHEHQNADDPRRGIPARMRLVTKLPLDELWNDRGLVSSERLRELDADGVREQLTEDAIAAIATVGARLEWIGGAKLIEWWEAEVAPSLIEDAADVPHDETPGQVWQASLWSRGWGSRILLFERYPEEPGRLPL